MLVMALSLMLGTAPASCPPDARRLMAEAAARVDAFDPAGAADRLRAAASPVCAAARVGALYLQGLVDARAAFRQGGSPDALAPVRAAVAALDAIARNRPGSAQIARLTLQAAAAAAQSERDEMALYLDAAMRMEALQRAAGEPGAPFISSVEAGGDLWLQLFRYADARRLYMRAVDEGHATMRALAGLARSAARLGVEETA